MSEKLILQNLVKVGQAVEANLLGMVFFTGVQKKKGEVKFLFQHSTGPVSISTEDGSEVLTRPLLAIAYSMSKRLENDLEQIEDISPWT